MKPYGACDFLYLVCFTDLNLVKAYPNGRIPPYSLIKFCCICSPVYSLSMDLRPVVNSAPTNHHVEIFVVNLLLVLSMHLGVGVLWYMLFLTLFRHFLD